MLETENSTYEKLYYELWETAERYAEIAQFEVIGKSHDDRLIPMVSLGCGEHNIFCIAGLTGRDRYLPEYLLKMLQEYARAWECGWKIKNLYDVREMLDKWRICFIPLLNPDGYEIYEKDFFAIRNPICRQMLRMQEIPSEAFDGNSRGVDLRKNFPTVYYKRKQCYSQPASENETKALIKVFQEFQGRGLLSFGYSDRRILYFRKSHAFAANQKYYRLARQLQRYTDTSCEKQEYRLEHVEIGRNSGYGSPEQFYTEICHQPAFRIEIPFIERKEKNILEHPEYREIHTLPLEYLFSM